MENKFFKKNRKKKTFNKKEKGDNNVKIKNVNVGVRNFRNDVKSKKVNKVQARIIPVIEKDFRGSFLASKPLEYISLDGRIRVFRKGQILMKFGEKMVSSLDGRCGNLRYSMI